MSDTVNQINVILSFYMFYRILKTMKNPIKIKIIRLVI